MSTVECWRIKGEYGVGSWYCSLHSKLAAVHGIYVYIIFAVQGLCCVSCSGCMLAVCGGRLAPIPQSDISCIRGQRGSQD